MQFNPENNLRTKNDYYSRFTDEEMELRKVG